MSNVNVAAIQLSDGSTLTENLQRAATHLKAAADAGAKLAVLPEDFATMGLDEVTKMSCCEILDDGGVIQTFLATQAKQNNIWLVGGTIPIRHEAWDYPDKAHAACLVFNAQGERVAIYYKIHLFDARVADKRGEYRESKTFVPGSEPVLVPTPWGNMGISVCYDVRFPELYRHLSQKGADFFVMMAAFTQVTGEAHWEILLRARAIENLAYVIASDQQGVHANGRETFGHSMIIDPWGKILQELPMGSGFVMAEMQLDQLRLLRDNFPVLTHRRICF